MTSTLVRGQIVSPLRTTPIVGTLLDAAEITTSLGSFLDTEDMFLTYNCLDFGTRTEFPCPDPGDPKTFGELDSISGARFAVYGGIMCKGFNETVDEAEATRAFEANESVGVEKAFMDTLFRQSAANVPEGIAAGELWAAAVDLTPAGGAVKPEVGLGILEGHAAWNYAGVPTIHSPRGITSIIWNRSGLERRGDIFYTPQGAKVASGGGYETGNTSPAGVAAPAGEKWVYGTGEVAVLRGETIVKEALDTSSNERVVLVERLYVAVVDCYKAAVRVKVE